MNKRKNTIAEEVKQLANSRLPFWKKVWYGINRFFDLNDPYPFTDPHWRRRDKIGMILSTFLVVVFVCFLAYLVYWAIVASAVVDNIGAVYG